MKKIFSFISVAAAMILSLGSCQNAAKEITQVEYTRVLTPTGLEAAVTAAGDVVSFNWSKAKGATAFELQIFTDPQLAGAERITAFVPADELPFQYKLLADETYYFQVRGIDDNNVLDPSNWAVYKDEKTGEPKSIKTYAIKPSVDPVVVERGETSITLGWTLAAGDTEISHILVKDGDGKENEVPVASVGSTFTVENLEPSTFYSLTVYFKSANRGSVVAWTRPSAQGLTTVTDSASFKQAVRDGATKILVAASDEPYIIGEIKATGDFLLIGESAADGTKPSVSGRITAQAGLTSLHVEDIAFSGAAVPANDKGEGALSISTHLFTAAAGSYTDIEFVNVTADDYQRGLYYDNSGGAVSGHILFDGVQSNHVVGSGGDNIDIRKAVNVNALILKNSTFNGGTRTFLRVDANQTFGQILVENCTFNNMCFDGGALVIGGSNVQGIFAVKATCENFVVRNNLFLNNNCWLVGGNTANMVPKFEKNYVYNSAPQFFTSAKLDDSGARSDMSEEIVLAQGGVLLAEDPCHDSEGEIFNVEEATVIKAGVGDPRWYVNYIDVPEDLTQNVTKAVHTYDFANSKVFYKMADKDMVRDEVRFYVKETPVLFEGGLVFQGPAKRGSDGVPADGAISIKVDAPGSLVITTQSVDADVASLVFYQDNVSVAAASDNEYRQQVVFADITPGQETMIYICPTAAVKITELQWNNETKLVADPELKAPVITSKKATVTQGDSYIATWEAVENAASYEVSVDGGKASAVSALEFEVKTGALAPGEHEVSVVALPASADMLRVKSAAASVEFAVKEKPAPTPGGTAGKIVFDEYVGMNPESISDGSITMTATLGASEDKTKRLVVDNNTCYFGDAESQVKFTTRLKTGAKSSANNAISLTIEEGAAGKLKVYARTGSNGDATRTISVTGASGEILSHTFDESKDKISGVVIPGEEAAKDVYTVLEADITAGKYDVFYPVNGINIYAFEFVPGGAPGPQPVSKSWVFASEDWQTELAKMGESGKDITGTWNITIDGLNYSASKSRWTNKAIQVTQDGRADGNGVFTFTAPAAGTVTVSASGTGSTPSGDRNVVITTDGASEQVSTNCNVPSNGDPATATFTVAAGEQKLYVTGALRIYSIAYDPAN